MFFKKETKKNEFSIANLPLLSIAVGFCVLIVVISRLTTASAGTSFNSCRLYYKGHYTHRSMALHGTEDGFSFHVIRNDSLQLEINDQTGDSSSYRISWVNDCTYRLVLISTTLKLSPAEFAHRTSKPLETVIIGRGGQYYLFKANRSDNNSGAVDTMWKREL